MLVVQVVLVATEVIGVLHQPLCLVVALSLQMVAMGKRGTTVMGMPRPAVAVVCWCIYIVTAQWFIHRLQASGGSVVLARSRWGANANGFRFVWSDSI